MSVKIKELLRFRNFVYVYKVMSSYVLGFIFDSDHSKFIHNINVVTLQFLCEILLIINLLYIQVQVHLIISLFIKRQSIFDRFRGIFLHLLLTIYFLRDTLDTQEKDNQKRMLITFSKLTEIILDNKVCLSSYFFNFRTAQGVQIFCQPFFQYYLNRYI